MKGLVRIVQQREGKGTQRGYQARSYASSRSKWFADSLHGGKPGAAKAATEWLLRMAQAHGEPLTQRAVRRNDKQVWNGLQPATRYARDRKRLIRERS